MRVQREEAKPVEVIMPHLLMKAAATYILLCCLYIYLVVRSKILPLIKQAGKQARLVEQTLFKQAFDI